MGNETVQGAYECPKQVNERLCNTTNCLWLLMRDILLQAMPMAAGYDGYYIIRQETKSCKWNKNKMAKDYPLLHSYTRYLNALDTNKSCKVSIHGIIIKQMNSDFQCLWYIGDSDWTTTLSLVCIPLHHLSHSHPTWRDLPFIILMTENTSKCWFRIDNDIYI